MKLYTYKFKYKLIGKLSDVSFIHIVANNKPEARKSALNRFNKMLNRDYGIKVKDLEYRYVTHLMSNKIEKDGFIDIYL